MSDPQLPDDVKLVASLFSGDDGLLVDAIRMLSETYGRTDFISAPLPFAYTDYYVKEFGETLIRRFLSFETLIRPESLPGVKIWTNALEKELSAEGRRRVNIDPGYLALPHLILATGKGHAHRPYLRGGVYADLTLIYRARSFQSLPWTYPDYGDRETIGMWNRVREKYFAQLKEKRALESSLVGGSYFDEENRP